MAQNEITATFSVGGMPSVSKVNYPLPPDPHSPDYRDVEGAQVADIGLNESVEVGHDGGVNCYGIDHSGLAGGGIKRNQKD